jgi:hypothetical protein
VSYLDSSLVVIVCGGCCVMLWGCLRSSLTCVMDVLCQDTELFAGSFCCYNLAWCMYSAFVVHSESRWCICLCPTT